MKFLFDWIIKSKKQIAICTLFISIFFLNSKIEVMANTLKEKEIYDVNKIWKVKFNDEISLNSLKEDSILIKDENGNKLTKQLSIGEDNKTILVHTLEKYNLDKSYTLVIQPNIYSKNNKKLKNVFELKFKVKPHCIINNGNQVVREDNWIYYSGNKEHGIAGMDSEQPSELYKLNADTNEKKKLTDDFASQIWLDGDWVYYIKYRGSHENNLLYRVKKDGSNRQKITNDIPGSVTIYGDYIYYKKWNVYQEFLEDDDWKIFRINKDGSGKTEICNNKVYGNYILYKNYIYYQNFDDNNKLYKVDINGNFKTKIIDDDINMFQIEDNWIYYLNKKGILKANLNGESLSIIDYNAICTEFIVNKGVIYYINYADNTLCKVNKDGTGKQGLVTNCCNISIQDNYIYYYKENENYTKEAIFKMDLNNNNEQSLLSIDGDYLLFFHLVGDWLYFNSEDLHNMRSKLFRMKIDGSQLTRVE